MKILESILEGIKEEYNLSGEKNISIYLNNIISNFIYLRSAYKKDFVKISYKDKKTQEAYLLAYYPHYTVPTFDVLEYIKKHHPKKNIPENLCLIGAGPAPEMIGFIKFINNQFKSYENIKNINIELIDIASEWVHARNIVKNILNNFCFARLKIYNFNNDFAKKITSSSSLLKRFKANPYKRVVVFQNIINEIEHKYHEEFIENFLKCFKNLAAGSFIIIIDLNYPIIRNVTYQIETRLKKNVIKGFGNSGDIVHRRTNIFLPQIIKNNLYDKSGTWSKATVKYGYSIFTKRR